MKLSAQAAKAAKQRIEMGETISKIADDFGVAYIAIWRIATGETHKRTLPAGRVIPARNKFDVDVKKLYLDKVRRGVTNRVLAVEHNTPESTVSHAVRMGKALIAEEANALYLTSGDYRAAMERFKLKAQQVQELVRYAAIHPLPAKLRTRVS